jgi:hypothetical protein
MSTVPPSPRANLPRQPRANKCDVAGTLWDTLVVRQCSTLHTRARVTKALSGSPRRRAVFHVPHRRGPPGLLMGLLMGGLLHPPGSLVHLGTWYHRFLEDPETPGEARSSPGDLQPGTARNIGYPGWSRHDYRAPGGHQPHGDGNDVLRVPRTPHEYGVEGPRDLARQLLSTGAHDSRALQAQLPDNCGEEGCPALSGLDQGHGEIRPHDSDRNPREPSTRAKVGHRPRGTRQDSQKQQAIEEEAPDDPVGIGRADEALNALPFQQQRQVFLE